MKKIRTRLLSMLLAIVMIAGLLPVTAQAAEEYGVWVGGVRVDSANAGDVRGDGKVVFTPAAGSEPAKLTLNGASIPGAFRPGRTDSAAGIYAEEDLTLELHGASAVNGTDADASSYGILINGYRLTVTGDGILDVTAGDSDYSCAISTNTMTMRSGAVAATAGKAADESEGIYSNGFTMAGGTLMAVGGEAATSWGVGGNVKINGGAVFAIGQTLAFYRVPDLSDYADPAVTVNTAASEAGVAAWNGTDPLGEGSSFKYVGIQPAGQSTYTPHIPAEMTLEYGNTKATTIGNIYVDDVTLQGTQNQVWCFGTKMTDLVNSNGDTIELRYSQRLFEMPIEEGKHALSYDNSSIGGCTMYSNGGSTYITAYVQPASIFAWNNAAPGEYTATVELSFQIYDGGSPVAGTEQVRTITIKAYVPDPLSQCGDDLYWSFDEDTGALTITGTGKMWDWDPNQGNSPPWAFISGIQEKIKTVSIADGVTSIGMYAFYNCKNMKDVTIPDSVSEIGPFAFISCESLRSVTIPAKVKNIGESAFYVCTSMREILVDEANPYYSSLNGVLYNKDQTVLIQFPGGTDMGVTIPDTVQRIEEKAFWYTYVSNVIIPEGITKAVFTGCARLTSMTLPSTIEEIDADMFRECERLQYVTIMSRDCVIVDDIGTLNNPASTQITGYKGSTAEAYAKKYGYQFKAFTEESGQCGEGLSWSYDGGTKELTITGTGKMDDFASYDDVPWREYNYSLQKITMSEGVASIGSYAFYGCGYVPDITIPESMTAIGEEAFAGCRGLTGVTVPKNVRSIGAGAFGGCTNLTEILVDAANTAYTEKDGALLSKDQTKLIACPAGKESYEIPASVTEIASRAFYGCSRLETLTIPKGVTSIADDAFLICCGMEAYYVDGANPNYSFLDGVLFNKDKTRLIQFPGGRGWDETYVIPDSVKSINRYAFYCNQELTGVVIPEGVPEICFTDCMMLQEVNIPASVTALGENAFLNCTNLPSVWIPATVKSIGKWAFDGCGCSTITILNKDCEIYDAQDTFGSSSGPKIFGYAGSTAEAYASKYGYKFQEIVPGPGKCGDDLTWTLDMEAGELTISGTGDMWDWGSGSDYSPWYPLAKSIKKVTIQDGVTGIGNNAFYQCAMTDVSIPDSVTRIGEFAFSHCADLKSVKIPGGVTVINRYMFNRCSSLQSVTLPDGITKIDYYAFEFCKSLKSITIPKSVTALVNGAFQGCESLERVTLQEGLKTIGVWTFSQCPKLAEVTIPASVEKIDTYAFNGSNNLTNLTILSKDCDIDSSSSTLGNSKVTTIRGYKGSSAEGYAKNNGYNFVDIEADPCKSGHDFGKWVQEQDPTCTEPGRQTRTCTRCGQIALREVAPMGHDYKDGACIRCGVPDPDYVPVETHPALKVSFKNVSPAEDSCMPGVEFRISFDVTNTGDTDLELEDFEWKNHKGVIASTTIAKTLLKPGESLSGKGTEALLVIDPIAKEDADPGTQTAEMYGLIKITCEVKGYQPGTGTVLCTGSATKETALLKEGHVHEWESDFTVDTDPTCTEAGSKSIHCRTCSAKKDVTAIPALGHDYKDGFCTRCGERDPSFVPGPVDPFRFDDVKNEKAFYYTPVYWAYEAKPQITNGIDKTHFGPDRGCTRGQVVTFLWRFRQSPAPKSTGTPFTDAGPKAFYAKAVAWAVENEITNGMTKTTFAPDATCTRGQVVTFLYRATAG